MALFKKRTGVTQAFRDNKQLQQFVLTGVTPTGKKLGSGSYGSVEEVSPYISHRQWNNYNTRGGGGGPTGSGG